MRTVILMNNGNKYVVEDAPIEAVAARLSSDELVKIPGTEGKPDFFINPLQVSAVFPAGERRD